VWVPSDEKTRKLWNEANGIGSFPYLLLLDRDGILRAEGHVEKLEKTVAELLKKKPRTDK
jgi:hypothetical protein